MGYAQLWVGFGAGGAAKRDLSNLTAHPNEDKHPLYLRGDGTFSAGALSYKGGVVGASVPATSTVAGDAYAITAAGTSQGKNWLAGDLAIYVGTSGNWTRVPLGFALGVSVDSYGAVGDGVTDDTTAINNAIAAAGPGRVVLFTDGKTYKTTSAITIPTDYITLSGYGAIITSATDSQFRKFIFSSRTRGAVRGLRFDCLYSSATTGLGVGTIEVSNSTDIDIVDCEFNDIAKNGVYVVGTSSRVLIENCRFYRNFCAIFSDDDTVNQPTKLSIIGNKIRTGLGATTTAYSGGIKISGTGSATSYAGHTIVWNQIDTAGEMGIELQTYVNDCAVSFNNIKGTKFGISLSVVNRIAVSTNTVAAVTYAGIEVAVGSSDIALGTNTVYTSETSAITVVSGSKNVSISGGALYGTRYSGVFFQDGYGLTISGVEFNGFDNALNVQGGHDVAMTGCTHDSAISTAAFGLVYLDAVDNPVYGINITGNRCYGARNCILACYTPNASVVRDVSICDNNIVNATCSAGTFNITAAAKALRITNRNNTGWGTIADFGKNLNIALYSTSTSVAWPTEYMYYERGIIDMDATAGNKTVQLPAPATVAPGYILTVRKADSGTNTVTVNPNAAETIDGASSIVLGGLYSRVTVECDGTNWVILQIDVTEQKSSTVANNAVSLTTATAANITSLSLPKGEWDISGSIEFAPAGTTTVTSVIAGLSATSATLGAVASDETRHNATMTTGATQMVATPVKRVTPSATTTYYLVGQASFGTSTMTAGGTLRARRFSKP